MTKPQTTEQINANQFGSSISTSREAELLAMKNVLQDLKRLTAERDKLKAAMREGITAVNGVLLKVKLMPWHEERLESWIKEAEELL